MVNLLRHKYCINDKFLFSESKSGSPIWATIIKVKQILQDGYQLRIGVGDMSI